MRHAYYSAHTKIAEAKRVLCDWCGSANVVERACKVVCRDCKRVSASCADL